MTLTPRLVVLMTLPPLLWAGNAVVGRLAVGHIAPLMLNALRWALALAILLVLGRRALATPAARRALAARWRELSMLGFLGAGTYNALQYLALHTSTPINVTLIAASSPLWMLAVGALFYRVRPGPREVWSALLSLVGVAVVLTGGDLEQLAALHFVPGDLLMLLAAATWAMYSWMLARPPERLAPPLRPDWDWAEFLLAQSIFGLAWASALAGAEALLMPPERIEWSPWLLLALVYVAVGPSVIAYRCWGLGVAAAGPALAAFFANLTPLFAALMSAALLGETPRAHHAVAFALIVAGIAVSTRGRAMT